MPLPRHMPAVLAYLGGEPWPEPKGLAEQLRQARLRQGLTQAQAAAVIGVDEGTVWWWETGRQPRLRDLKLRLETFIKEESAEDVMNVETGTERDNTPLFDFGQALRIRRSELRLTQAQVAVILGVDTWTILGWEGGGRTPMDRFFPALIRFLEREPWPSPITIAERIRAERLRRGLSQGQAAAIMQVNRASITAWENGRSPKHRLSLAKIDAFLLGNVRPWRCRRSPTGRRQANRRYGSRKPGDGS